MAMSTAPMPSSPARAWLVMAGLSASLASLGCQVGEPDVVRRSPDLGHGTGGADGQEDPAVDASTDDTTLGSGLGLDGASATIDTPWSDGALADSAPGSDGADVPYDVSLDANGRFGDAGSAGEVSDPCGTAGYVFCDGFEYGRDLWTTTAGTWVVTEAHGASGDTQVFGPTTPAASIAYVASGVWQDMTVTAKVMVTSFGQSSSANRAEVYARYQDPGHFYALSIRGDGKLGLRRNASGLGTAAGVSVGENEWHVLEIRVSGSTDDVVVEGYLDGTLLTTATDSGGSPTGEMGTVGVGVYGGALAVFDDVTVSSP